jgi:hypothetical protein
VRFKYSTGKKKISLKNNLNNMTTVYKYRVSCATHGYVYVWSETEPTVCPNNYGDTIYPAQTVIVDKVETNTVAIKEETIPTQGYFRSVGFSQNITDATPGSLTTFNHSWPYRTSLLEGWFFATSAQIGDYVEVFAAPNTPVGAIAAPVSAGATTFSVTGTVIPNCALGYSIKLSDGVNVDDCGEIISMNSSTNQITVQTATTHSFSPLSPTYVLLTVKVIEGFYINVGEQKYEFARKKVGGKTIPPNVPISIIYHNVSGGTKKFCYNMEILY